MSDHINDREVKNDESIYNELIADAEALRDKLMAFRREFHRHPELAWRECRTSEKIAAFLEELGFDEVLTGDAVCKKEARMAVPADGEMTGVIGILHCGEGPTLAMRFDIDALPILETDAEDHFPVQEDFRSLEDGVMHACGHDGHITVGLGTAELLIRHRDQLHGTIKFIFQPAEEGVRGAKSIAENHHLDDVDFLLGSHMSDIGTLSPEAVEKAALLFSPAATGEENVVPAVDACIGVGPGGSLATTKMDAVFTGTAAHAGMTPNEGDNALLAAATAVLNLHGIPRYAGADTRVNVGRIEGGTARNIVCGQVRMELEVRGESSEANSYMEAYAIRILKAAADMHGCQVEIHQMGSAKSVRNDAKLSETVLTVCREKMHLPSCSIEEKMAGSEDYSYLSEAVQAHGGESCYFNNFVPCAGPFHSTGFDFDERALVNGVKAFCGCAVFLLTHS